MVEIGLTDLPNSGGALPAHGSAIPVRIVLYLPMLVFLNILSVDLLKSHTLLCKFHNQYYHINVDGNVQRDRV